MVVSERVRTSEALAAKSRSKKAASARIHQWYYFEVVLVVTVLASLSPSTVLRLVSGWPRLPRAEGFLPLLLLWGLLA